MKEEYTYVDGAKKEDVGKKLNCILCDAEIEIEPLKNFEITTEKGFVIDERNIIDRLGAYCEICEAAWIGKNKEEIEEQLAMDASGGERYECRGKEKKNNG